MNCDVLTLHRYRWLSDKTQDLFHEGTPVMEAYQVPFKFTGMIDRVTIELSEITKSAAVETDKARKEAALKKALSD